MTISFVCAINLKPGMYILRRITDYSFVEEKIKLIEMGPVGSDIFITLEGMDGYSIKAQENHIFQVTN